MFEIFCYFWPPVSDHLTDNRSGRPWCCSIRPWAVQETEISQWEVLYRILFFRSWLLIRIKRFLKTRGRSLQLPYTNEAKFWLSMVSLSLKRPPHVSDLCGRFDCSSLSNPRWREALATVASSKFFLSSSGRFLYKSTFDNSNPISQSVMSQSSPKSSIEKDHYNAY